MFKVASITGGVNQPSSRYRVRQYIEVLKRHNIQIDDFYSVNGKYPPANKHQRIIWGLKALFERLLQVVKINSREYDCVIVQREMMSTLHTFERFLNKNKILDVDDAVYLHKNGNFIKEIAAGSKAVICGNEYIADKFKNWNDNIYVVPTAVDTNMFIPLAEEKRQNEIITLGWIGTSGGFKYVYKIEDALNFILNKYPNVELLIVSDMEPVFKKIKNYKFVKWSAQKEVENFQKIDIGLMPLNDDEWTRGKCSYKMLQYMACESSVVVSSVGMNEEVLKKSNVGFGTKDYYSDWIKSIEFLINNKSDRIMMGKNGRLVVEEYYSLDKLSEKLSCIIKDIVSR